jgi:hypothetical protein
MIDKHRDVLEEATSEHDKMKKAVDELRASEVLVVWLFFTSLKVGVFLL